MSLINEFSRQENEFQAWQAINELQRERIVVEISDLVHRQLVTSALESDFRHHLEQNVLVRYLYLIIKTFNIYSIYRIVWQMEHLFNKSNKLHRQL